MNKMFSGSVIALLLGVFLAVPLLYTNTVTAPHPDMPDMFDVNVVYAYLERKNITVPEDTPFTQLSDTNDTVEIQTINRIMGINFTRLSEEFTPCDARIEVYQIKLYSDEGLIGTLQRHEGIIYSDILGDPMFNDMSEFFGDRPPSGGGSMYTNWDVGQSRLGCSSGGGTNWVPTFGEPETIYMSVNRLGWVTISGYSNETTILSEPEVVAEVQLEKFGDGFLYNNIIPADEMSQIDPLKPTGRLFELMGY